ncbi:DUF418 domain-containing protein [Paenibacillus sp. SC116]|uniref:DUF418 domain-containing protein n=1 Tax=Paenibacillus sp. SC116 TaxID=2968986 RepID=UPI00215A66B0|nr:DUF418 domain-containing protein [Paenibacillus sp. SC116]MCR8845891.1 DUF418 domain-containing protein [Paenibacillus sp. SC116]
MNEQESHAPQQNRIVELDMIRGFAMMGIFLVNIFNFIQLTEFDNSLFPNYDWIEVLFTGKFYAIFSLLFGAGAAIFLTRAKQKGTPYRFYIRRMLVLAIIGYIHSLVWGGDVLLPYAIIGLVLLALHKIPAKILFMISASLHIIGIIVNISAYDYLHVGKPGIPISLDIMLLITAMTSFLVYFVEGFTLMNMNILSSLKKMPLQHARLLIIFGMISIVSVIAQFTLTEPKLKHILLITSQPILVVFYILTLLALSKTKLGTIVLSPLNMCGKMAMSNYLGQTAVGILILPLLIDIASPAFLILGVCAITWVVQIALSHLWLSQFRFGPVEWIWRCLTYWRLFPLRK